jgi:trans-aconitate 2-methyltransferase
VGFYKFIRLNILKMKNQDQNKKYRWDAAEYTQHSSNQQQWARELLAKLQLEGHESVLDIGCGEGKVTAEIAEGVPKGRVVGIDSSEEMISAARSLFPSQKYPNLTFLCKNALDLNFENQFEVVFSNAALHWIKDHKKVLQGISRALKPSGKLLLQMGGKGNAWETISVLNVVLQKPKWKNFFKEMTFPYTFHGPEEYGIWLKENNLRVIRSELIPKIMEYDGRDSLAGWIRTTWLPYTERVPEDLKKSFITEIINTYLSLYPETEKGKILVKMVRLEVEAEKSL